MLSFIYSVGLDKYFHCKGIFEFALLLCPLFSILRKTFNMGSYYHYSCTMGS